MKLFLKEPTLKDKEEVLAMVNELNTCNDEYPFEGAGRLDQLLNTPYEEWLDNCMKDKTIETIKPEWSNGTNYLLVDDNNHVYGFSQLRNSLKGNLINIGGNIGYIIRPSERKKGYGIFQLKLLLEKAHEMGLDKVLVTCRENNIGSKKTIERCMGTQDYSVPSKYEGIMELRYWINTKNKQRGDNMKHVLETERLILRNYRKEDLQDYWELVSSPEVGPRAGWPAYTDINVAKERLETKEVNKEYQFAIVLKEENKVIGSLEIMDVHETRFDGVRLPENTKEIGFILNDKYWGRGIMTEALEAAKKFAFEELHLDALAMCHAKANVGSGRVQEKNGFNIVGIRKDYRTWIDGTVTSLIQRVMTKDEYFSMKKAR